MHASRQVGLGFIHNPCDVKYSQQIVQEILKLRAVVNLFLHVWFQQLVECYHSVWPNLCFLGTSLTWNKNSQIIGKTFTEIFWETALTWHTHIHYCSLGHKLVMFPAFIQNRNCFLQPLRRERTWLIASRFFPVCCLSYGVSQ